MSDRLAQLRQHLHDEHGLDASALPLDAPLFVGGRLDSIGLVDLLAFMQRAWGVRVPWSDVTLESLGTMEKILEYAARRSAG